MIADQETRINEDRKTRMVADERTRINADQETQMVADETTRMNADQGRGSTRIKRRGWTRISAAIRDLIRDGPRYKDKPL